MQKLVQYAGLLTALLATQAHAYIGPGAGAGTIAVMLGIIASILLACIAIIWYPLKRLIKGRKTPDKNAEKKPSDNE